MQISIFPENGIHASMAKAPQIKSQSVQLSGSVFGAQCKVTISKEGRKLSEQSNRQTARSAASIKAEKMMLRQQEQSEQLDQQSDELKDKYADLLKTIDQIMKSTKGSYLSKTDEETIAMKEHMLREISDQKQKQLDENQKQAKYAQEMAMQSSKTQEEIDKKNRDLVLLLKSIEESEKTEEEEENGGKVEENDSNGAKTKNSVGEAIQNSATQFMASSAKRELDVMATIQELNDKGHAYIRKANEIAEKAFDEAGSIRNLLNDENYTNAQKKDAVLHYGAKMIGAYNSLTTDEPYVGAFDELEILLDDNENEEALSRYRAKMNAGSDLAAYRQRGVQMIKDAKEGKLKHIEANPLQGVEETKSIMMQSAVDAVFNEAAQGKLDETSQELEDEVKELIDRRNDIDHVDADKKEEDEDQKEIGELLEPKEEEQEQEQIQE